MFILFPLPKTKVTLSSLNDQVRIGPDGREYSFIHELARNLSKEAYLAASTNLKLRKDNLKLFNSGSDRNYEFANNDSNHDDEDDDDEGIPLPPMSMILGTDQLDDYWHRVLLGIVEIQVDTMVVNEKDFGKFKCY